MRQVISGPEVLDILYEIKDDIFSDMSYRAINFKKTLSIMASYHQEYPTYDEFAVGTFELWENSALSLGEAMVPIVGLFHEVSGHGDQIKTEFNKTTPLSKVLALNYYACQGSDYYYEGFGPDKSKQYWKQPHEIAAQYMGIKSAYYYLSQEWGQQDATEAICAYEKFRQDNHCAFLDNHKTYSDVESILSDLNKKFQKCVYAKRHYVYTEAIQFSHDSLLSLAAITENRLYISDMQNSHNGLKSDWMMTSAYVWHRDYTYEIRSKPVFKDIPLDPNVAFEKRNQPIHPKPKRSDLDLNQLTLADAIKELEESQLQI